MLEMETGSMQELHRLMDDTRNGDLVARGTRLRNQFHRDLFKYDFRKKKYTATKEALATRLAGLLSSEALYDIVSGKSTFSIPAAFNTPGLYVFNLGKGVIGDTAGPMLGRLILSQLQAAAFKREKDGLTEEKVPTKNYVFIDEFQNFVSPTTGTIVAEARKYGISLILIQQYVGQGIDPGLMQNILTNTPLKITGVGTLSSYEKVMASNQVEREGFEGLRPRRFHVSRRGGRPFVTVAHGFLAGGKERMTQAEQVAFTELQLSTYYRSPHPQAEMAEEDGEAGSIASPARRSPRRPKRPPAEVPGMNRLTVRQQQVLEALADYHYLVPAQMVRLSLSKSTGAMRRTLRRFEFELRGADGTITKNSRASIGAIRTGVDRDSGRIARMYYLTRLGTELVAEHRQTDPALIFYPRGDKLVLADIPHRKLAIDFRIELDRFAKEHNYTIEFYHQYFRTTGGNRNTEMGERLRKLTRIDFPAELAQRYRKPFFWPDGIFVLNSGSKRTLCLVEAYRGGDTGRVMQQLVWHVVALDHGLPSEKYGLKTAHRVLVVFEEEKALARVILQLMAWNTVDKFREFILCSTIGRLRENFQDWYSVREGKIAARGLI